MLWKRYVFRRGDEVHDMWDRLYDGQHTRLLYVAGHGFDTRAQQVMESFIPSCKAASSSIEALLLLVKVDGYELSPDLVELTETNASELKRIFSQVGTCQTLPIGFSAGGEDDLSASNALRIGAEAILEHVGGYTDIVVDVSTLPRVVYVTLMTSLLKRLIVGPLDQNPLVANGVSLQMLVAEDASLDAHIQPEDPSNDLILIPGFSAPLQVESVRDWPLVWFPILGENRVSQFAKVMEAAIPNFAEICPVLPHPARNHRRADELLMEYRKPLFDARQTPTSNIIYVHESHPFEAYRQLVGAMERYSQSLGLLGGCRLVVTPLGSKLITLGATLACYEIKTRDADAQHGVAIPYAEPRRYVASPGEIAKSRPEICSLLLTGRAYSEVLQNSLG
jgi:hypothetical protein